MGSPAIVRVKELFEPSEELQVSVSISIDNILDGDRLCKSNFFEGALDNLPISNEILVLCRLELDLVHGDGVLEQHVHQLCIRRTRSQLLDVIEIGFNGVIDPCSQFVDAWFFRKILRIEHIYSYGTRGCRPGNQKGLSQNGYGLSSGGGSADVSDG